MNATLSLMRYLWLLYCVTDSDEISVAIYCVTDSDEISVAIILCH